MAEEKKVSIRFHALLLRLCGNGMDYSTFSEAVLCRPDPKICSLPTGVVDIADGVVRQMHPIDRGYCYVDGSLFFNGTFPFSDQPNSLWSIDLRAAASPPPGDSSHAISLVWKHRAIMNSKRRRSGSLSVPYDGKIFIFGGQCEPETWGVEIYDLKSGKFLDKPGGIPPLEVAYYDPMGYFLWDSRSTKARAAGGKQKPLIMLYYQDPQPRLYAYDVEKTVEEGRWSLFDSYFPAPPCEFRIPCLFRNLIPLDGNILLIIDHAATWCIYDLYYKRPYEEVQVIGLDKEKDRKVAFAFCRRCSDKGSLTFFLFMEADYDTFTSANSDIPYAKVLLETGGGKFVATLEWEDTLRNVGDYYDLWIFAEETTKRTAERTLLEVEED